MNGFHAELFSYSLYHDVLSPLDKNGSLKRLKPSGYYAVKGTDQEPYFRLNFDHGDCDLRFLVEFKNRRFHTRINRSAVDPFPKLHALLCGAGGFIEGDHVLSKNSTSDAIKDSLIDLAELLSTLPEESDD